MEDDTYNRSNLCRLDIFLFTFVSGMIIVSPIIIGIISFSLIVNIELFYYMIFLSVLLTMIVLFSSFFDMYMKYPGIKYESNYNVGIRGNDLVVSYNMIYDKMVQALLKKEKILIVDHIPIKHIVSIESPRSMFEIRDILFFMRKVFFKGGIRGHMFNLYIPLNKTLLIATKVPIEHYPFVLWNYSFINHPLLGKDHELDKKASDRLFIDIHPDDYHSIIGHIKRINSNVIVK